MQHTLKWIAGRLPPPWQQTLKRLHHARAINRGTFSSDEPEADRLADWVGPGDWVLDIGANIGHYTCALSQLVGPRGRVIAVEPVPRTFELLAANVARFPFENVTLLNMAASDASRTVTMSLPRLSTGLSNYYMASITSDGVDGISALAIALDSLDLPHRIALIKLDVEGHELPALLGLRGVLTSDRPILIVEGNDAGVEKELNSLGFRFEQLPGSPNRVFHPQGHS